MANAANHVTLSTGQILFADPTLPWAPSNFPNLPSTALTLTGIGTIAGRNVEKLSFSNVIQYANYESAPLRGSLIKSLVTNSQGVVYYDDPRVSLLSTSLSEYQIGITSFGSSNIGAPGIQSSPADSLTTAIGKIDGWISQLLMSQPPSVTYAETENTSLYAGTRWYNFNVYNTLGNSVPYVSGIVVMLGDPASGDYLTLELTNSTWFPDRQFQDGLASDFYPIVRLRIFNEFFLGSADQLYSKAYMQTQCVKIIGEGGIYTLPSTGKVFAVENSVSGLTYTTLNLYLPQIPVGADIPVRIIYINKTQTTPNIYYTSTSTTTFGGPSAPQNILQTMSTPTSFTLQVSPPVYSDEAHSVSTCYFSSYNLTYTASQLNTAHAGDLGFRYGQAAPTPLPAYLSNYSTFNRTTAVESGPTQQILVAGADNYRVLPGLQWSTTIYATNSAMIIGSTIGGPTPVVSAFPFLSTPNISSTQITVKSPWGVDSNSQDLSYLVYQNGWRLGSNLSTSVLYLASTQLTLFGLSTYTQFNDVSYPGSRSNVTVTSIFKDLDEVDQPIYLTINSVSDDFTLNSNYVASDNNNYLSTLLSDSQTDVAFKKFYYNATPVAGYAVSSISTQVQSIEFKLENSIITGYNNPIVPQLLSTPLCYLTTEPACNYNMSTIVYTSTVRNTVPITGLYSPQIGSELLFDIHASNFAHFYACSSNLGAGQIYYNGSAVGPIQQYISSVFVYEGSTEINTLPFAPDSTLRLSSCVARITSNIYQDPTDPFDFEIRALATPANPMAPRIFQSQNIGPFLYIDTVGAALVSTFTNMNTSNGLRVLSLLPRYESPGTVNNMNDGISASGQASNGLNTSISSFFIMGSSNALTVSSSVVYNNSSTISSFYTDAYSRELLYTNGAFTHPGGLDFSLYSGRAIGNPSATYPNFTTDLSNDVNYGNRYASFLFNGYSNNTPQAYQYLTVRVKNVSALSTITNSRDYNYAFPDEPIPDTYLPYSKVRMHAKLLGNMNNGFNTDFETAWINCFKPIDYNVFDDNIFDVGGLVYVSTSGADVYYKVQFARRFYTSIYPIVRVGISRDGSAEELPGGSAYLPITFESITATVSDSL